MDAQPPRLATHNPHNAAHQFAPTCPLPVPLTHARTNPLVHQLRYSSDLPTFVTPGETWQAHALIAGFPPGSSLDAA